MSASVNPAHLHNENNIEHICKFVYVKIKRSSFVYMGTYKVGIIESVKQKYLNIIAAIAPGSYRRPWVKYIM